MSTIASQLDDSHAYPVDVDVEPALDRRNRLTTFFRIILAVPHLLLVGGPMLIAFSWGGTHENGMDWEWGTGGVLGAVAVVAAMISWVAIVFTGRHPKGLWDLAVFYLRWRVRAVAYLTLLRDEYPPFGEAPYPASMTLTRPDGERDRVTVGFRVILAIPQLFVAALLSCAWLITTMIAWWVILFTGRYPAGLYTFGANVLRYNMRVEAYVLLLRDEYPPFSLD